MIKKNAFLLFIFSFFMTAAGAQELRVPAGRVMDSVAVADSLDQSFALYLPRTFSEERSWPVIFVFDPEGRGRATAQLLKSAAEEQGYIIASSNEDLKEVSLQANLTKASQLMKTVFNSFPVDRDQVFSIGLKEGGMLASAVPLLYKDTAGVLAIGDAWVNAEFIEKSSPYFFSAAVAYRDNSQYQLEKIADIYEKEDHPVAFGFYEGENGDWPSAKFMEAAVSAFTFHAIDKGFRDSDPQLVKGLYEHELAVAEELRRKGLYYKAYEKLEQLEEKYEDFEDATKDKMKNVRRSPVYREQRREFRNAREEESLRIEMFRLNMEGDILATSFENVGWWAYQMDELEKLQEEGNWAQKEMAFRLEGYLADISRYYFQSITESEAKIDKKILASILRTVIDKNDPEAYLKIIELAGKDGDYETALLYLEDLLKTGYKNMESLYEIPGILDLKFSKEYNQLIREYLGESKYYKASETEG